MSTTTLEAVFKPEELRKARTEAMNEAVEEMRVFARKAPDPAKRIALSELEQLLRAKRSEWAELGLVDQPEGAAAMAAVPA